MKKKIYTRPVSVVLSQEIFVQIQEITNQEDISISDYIRKSIQEKLTGENSMKKEERP